MLVPIPLSLDCFNCGKEVFITIKLTDQNANWICDECGWDNDYAIGPGISLGIKLLFRSHNEFNKIKDFNLSIVLSAMAVDCELSRLFLKWAEKKAVGDLELTDEEKIKSFFEKCPTIKKKLKRVCGILYPDGIQKFFRKNSYLKSSLAKRIDNFSSKSFYDNIVENLFWKRNRVLHLGNISFDYEDAVQCYSIANILLEILNRMDLSKREQTP